MSHTLEYHLAWELLRTSSALSFSGFTKRLLLNLEYITNIETWLKIFSVLSLLLWWKLASTCGLVKLVNFYLTCLPKFSDLIYAKQVWYIIIKEFLHNLFALGYPVVEFQYSIEICWPKLIYEPIFIQLPSNLINECSSLPSSLDLNIHDLEPPLNPPCHHVFQYFLQHFPPSLFILSCYSITVSLDLCHAYPHLDYQLPLILGMHHLADLLLHAAADGMSIKLHERSIHLGLVNCLLLLQGLSSSVIKRIEVLFLFHSMGN